MTYKPNFDELIVVQDRETDKHRLRVYVDLHDAGVVVFQTLERFTKPEADYRAFLAAKAMDLSHEPLPTHPYELPFPDKEG